MFHLLNHPVNEAVLDAYSPSVGASAVTAYARVGAGDGFCPLYLNPTISIW